MPKDVTSYYIDMSASGEGKIAGLRTPTLAVSSRDDPIMDGSPTAALKNVEDLFVLTTKYVQVLYACEFVSFRESRS